MQTITARPDRDGEEMPAGLCTGDGISVLKVDCILYVTQGIPSTRFFFGHTSGSARPESDGTFLAIVIKLALSSPAVLRWRNISYHQSLVVVQ